MTVEHEDLYLRTDSKFFANTSTYFIYNEVDLEFQKFTSSRWFSFSVSHLFSLVFERKGSFVFSLWEKLEIRIFRISHCIVVCCSTKIEINSKAAKKKAPIHTYIHTNSGGTSIADWLSLIGPEIDPGSLLLASTTSINFKLSTFNVVRLSSSS